jgi:hypothetical protein
MSESIGGFEFQKIAPGNWSVTGEVTHLAPLTNPSGYTPTEYKVLIEPDTVEEVTKGGVIKPDMVKDGEMYGQTEGTIIAASPLAFSYANEAEWEAAKAEKP